MTGGEAGMTNLAPSPLEGEGGGEGYLVRDGLTLSFRLVPSCHSRRYSPCHSRLFPLVIPDISHPVIPDVINRESKAGVRGAGETRRNPTLLRSLHHGAEKKDPGFPLKTCGNDKVGEAGMTGGERG